ncbi:hypothetical protein BHE74_00057777 [Ensete ventricosum]|nr:hypothetical protein BHE74_00057777 [Ensete ventricosum]
MHPLRFSISGIRAKGQPAGAKAPCKRATDCSQGQPAREAADARKGGRRRPQGAADANDLQLVARKGNSPQGRYLRAEAPPTRADTCRQKGQRPPAANPQRDGVHRGAARGSDRPLVGRLLVDKVVTACIGAAQ